MSKLGAVVILLAGSLLVGCSARLGRSINTAVDATTGIGAIDSKRTQADPQLAKVQCVSLCQQQLAAAADLSSGPCLANPIQGISDWVCDIAHTPRAVVDDDPTHQCSTYATGAAKHFVEVDEECNIISVH